MHLMFAATVPDDAEPGGRGRRHHRRRGLGRRRRHRVGRLPVLDVVRHAMAAALRRGASPVRAVRGDVVQHGSEPAQGAAELVESCGAPGPPARLACPDGVGQEGVRGAAGLQADQLGIELGLGDHQFAAECGCALDRVEVAQERLLRPGARDPWRDGSPRRSSLGVEPGSSSSSSSSSSSTSGSRFFGSAASGPTCTASTNISQYPHRPVWRSPPPGSDRSLGSRWGSNDHRRAHCWPTVDGLLPERGSAASLRGSPVGRARRPWKGGPVSSNTRGAR